MITKSDLKFLLKNGFFHIFSSNVVNKILQFGISIVIVRIISKELFGAWSYANNILSFFLLVNGLGVSSGLLQFSSAAKDKKLKVSYLKYALSIGIIFNVVLSITILVFTFFFDLPIKESVVILRWMAFIPFFVTIFNNFQVFLRSDFKNKEFSLITVFNTFIYFLGILIGGYFFSIKGIVASRYIAFVASIALSLYFMKEYFELFKSTTFPKKNERKIFFRFSIIAMITNSISSILYLIDTFLVGNILKASEIVATYKTATLIPFSLNFIPLSIMTFAYPYFAQNFENKSKIKQYYIKLQKTLLLINSIISLLLITFAPYIIKIVFGEKYLDSLPIFRVLSFGYLIAGTFRIPAGNVLSSIRKIKINLINAIISGSVNIILDILLIKHYGAIGAAYATVSIFIISSLISNVFLYYHLTK